MSRRNFKKSLTRF